MHEAPDRRLDAPATPPQLDLWDRLEVASRLLRCHCPNGNRSEQHRERAQLGLCWDRQSKCCRTPYVKRGDPLQARMTSAGSWSLVGFVHCDHYTCPSCGRRRARETAAAIGAAIERWLALPDVDVGARHDVWMLTFTLPHYPDQAVDGVLDALYRATEMFFRGRAWKRFARRWGVAAKVRVLDVTFNRTFAAHPHFHVALFVEHSHIVVDGGDVAHVKAMRQGMLDHLTPGLTPAWEAALVELDLEIRDVAQLREHGIKLSPAEDAAQYFTKWGLADEVGGTALKARNHLRLLDHHAAGDAYAGYAFRVWRAATHGRAWVTGLEDMRQRVGVDDAVIEGFLVELRRRRELEMLANGETPPAPRTPLVLDIRPQLVRAALTVGWSHVFAAVDAAATPFDRIGDPSGAQHAAQVALDHLLFSVGVRGPPE